jgi:hypothetical protein
MYNVVECFPVFVLEFGMRIHSYRNEGKYEPHFYIIAREDATTAARIDNLGIVETFLGTCSLAFLCCRGAFCLHQSQK